jgi:hypothetical protein
VSPDPDLVKKIRDLVALYMNPPAAAAVFAVDEKPQVQALNRTAPTLPMLPTTPARATHDYERNGTLDLFAAFEVATGKVITDLRARHASADFVAFLNKVNREVPNASPSTSSWTIWRPVLLDDEFLRPARRQPLADLAAAPDPVSTLEQATRGDWRSSAS